MLVELGVVDERHAAVLEVLNDGPSVTDLGPPTKDGSRSVGHVIQIGILPRLFRVDNRCLR